MDTSLTPSTRSTERFALNAQVGHVIPLMKMIASGALSLWSAACSDLVGATHPNGRVVTAKTDRIPILSLFISCRSPLA